MNDKRHSYHSGNSKGYRALCQDARTKNAHISYYTTTIYIYKKKTFILIHTQKLIQDIQARITKL